MDLPDVIDGKILRGIQQLDRGEGIAGDEALAQLKARKEAWLKQNPTATD